MFAFLAIVGTQLRLAGPRTRPQRRVVHALVAACAIVAITGRVPELTVVAARRQRTHAGGTHLWVLLLLVAITTGVVTLAAQSH